MCDCQKEDNIYFRTCIICGGICCSNCSRITNEKFGIMFLHDDCYHNKYGKGFLHKRFKKYIDTIYNFSKRLCRKSYEEKMKEYIENFYYGYNFYP
jgi:hypothetical protein